jgi:hypothetical protein
MSAIVPSATTFAGDVSLGAETLQLFRSSSISTIIDVSKKEKVKKEAIATAAIFFHRFFARRSFTQHDRLEIALACVLAASKSTDFCKQLHTKPLVLELLARQGYGLTGDGAGAGAGGPPSDRSEAGVLAKERLLAAERLLLCTLEFDVIVEPPTTALDEALAALARPSDVLKRMAHSALWDALKTTLPLVHDARTLALGALHFAHHACAAAAAKQPDIVFETPANWSEVVTLSEAAASNFGRELALSLSRGPVDDSAVAQ